jgi:hypothetical protein
MTGPVYAGGIALVLLALGPSAAVASIEGMVTEVIEPGVERVLEDGAPEAGFVLISGLEPSGCQPLGRRFESYRRSHFPS